MEDLTWLNLIIKWSKQLQTTMDLTSDVIKYGYLENPPFIVVFLIEISTWNYSRLFSI